jgi:UDP-N-acetylmuramoyl-L-alanyl-D-glutamate--2,6-diaminopimelate ligase
MFRKIKNFYHLLVAIFANIIFWFPARKLTVIGVTGTDGKTTTTGIIYHVLNSSGRKAAMIGTINGQIGEKDYDTELHRTTPSSLSLQRFMRKAKNAGSKYFVLEVTSHAIDQHRIWGIPFKFGVLTNVTYEHLDYHKTYDSYFKVKTSLLKRSKINVVNKDDGTYTFLVDVQRLKDPKNWITYGLDAAADVSPKNFPFQTKLLGEFNKYNALAAIAVCRALGIEDEEIRSAIASYVNPVGRADVVYSKDFAVMIDFAHTPNAFDQILRTVRPLFKGRVIHVFGTAGKRDFSKRPMMGEISSRYADIMILTAEDPRGEPISKISDEIASGVGVKKSEVIKIPDRAEAIQAAINMAKKGDVVIITGKSHEKSINLNGKDEIPWDEYQVVRVAINKKENG